MFCPDLWKLKAPVSAPAQLRPALSWLTTKVLVSPAPVTVPPAPTTAPSEKNPPTYWELPFRSRVPPNPTSRKLLAERVLIPPFNLRVPWLMTVIPVIRFELNPDPNTEGVGLRVKMPPPLLIRLGAPFP